MARNILIAGTDDLTATQLAAKYLALPDDRVLYLASVPEKTLQESFLTQVTALILRCARGAAPKSGSNGFASALNSRLTVAANLPDRDNAGSPDMSVFAEYRHFDAVWYFGAEAPSARESRTASALASGLDRAGIGFGELNYVGCGVVPGESASVSRREDLAALSDWCAARKIVHRVFQTSLIVGYSGLPGDRENHPLVRFLAELHDLKSELEERLAEYFDYQSLRCHAPGGADVNIISADQAAEEMLQIAERGMPPGVYTIASRGNLSFAELCNRIGRAFTLSLKKTDNRDLLNAVDLLFERRTRESLPYLAAASSSAGPSNGAGEKPIFDEQAQTAMFRLLRRGLYRARVARDRRAVDLETTLKKKTVDREGFALNYYAGGAGGDTIVILNALGHGLHYWTRLIDCLAPHYHIVIWELRGTFEASREFRISDQLDDLEAILHREEIETCHIVGWCTGAKVAIEFYRRRPHAVDSMVFLNSTFSCSGGPAQFKTIYERDFEPLCRVVSDRPQTAGSVMQALRDSAVGGTPDDLDEMDGKELAASVLTMTNAHLKPHVLAPFRDEATTVSYSRQVLDFLSCDASANAGGIQSPILLVASEYDRIASPAGARAMSALFPEARYVEVPGATHYCQYDSPELIAQLLLTFIRNPKSADVGLLPA